eukprot:Sspe_Gene.112531::Locus_95583_Transcript_1_1_Confidence_1.000_Length_926::g.112531::m.112531
MTHRLSTSSCAPSISDYFRMARELPQRAEALLGETTSTSLPDPLLNYTTSSAGQRGVAAQLNTSKGAEQLTPYSVEALHDLSSTTARLGAEQAKLIWQSGVPYCPPPEAPKMSSSSFAQPAVVSPRLQPAHPTPIPHESLVDEAQRLKEHIAHSHSDMQEFLRGEMQRVAEIIRSSVGPAPAPNPMISPQRSTALSPPLSPQPDITALLAALTRLADGPQPRTQSPPRSPSPFTGTFTDITSHPSVTTQLSVKPRPSLTPQTPSLPRAPQEMCTAADKVLASPVWE